MNSYLVGAGIIVIGVLAYGWWDSAARGDYYRWRAEEARRDASAALMLSRMARAQRAAADAQKTAAR